jgi:hypothetical protein
MVSARDESTSQTATNSVLSAASMAGTWRRAIQPAPIIPTASGATSLRLSGRKQKLAEFAGDREVVEGVCRLSQVEYAVDGRREPPGAKLWDDALPELLDGLGLLFKRASSQRRTHQPRTPPHQLAKRNYGFVARTCADYDDPPQAPESVQVVGHVYGANQLKDDVRTAPVTGLSERVVRGQRCRAQRCDARVQ